MKRRFSERELRELRNEIPVEELIENHLRMPVRRVSGRFRFSCPICSGYSPRGRKQEQIGAEADWLQVVFLLVVPELLSKAYGLFHVPEFSTFRDGTRRFLDIKKWLAENIVDVIEAGFAHA